MAQRRYHEFNSPVDDAGLRRIFGGSFRHQLRRGFKPTVASAVDGTINITPGTVVLDSGVVLDEDETKQVTIPLGAPAVNYTVYYKHTADQIIGGSTAVLTVEDSLTFYDLTDEKTPLFWVIYPGSNVQLSDDHIFPAVSVDDVVATRHAVENSTRFLNPIGASGNDADVSVFSGLVGGLPHSSIELAATAGGAVTGQVVNFPCWYPGYGKPRAIILNALIDASCSISSVRLFDIAGSTATSDSLAVLPINPAVPITANGAFTEYKFVFQGTSLDWSKPGLFSISVTVALAVGGSIDFRLADARLMGETE